MYRWLGTLVIAGCGFQVGAHGAPDGDAGDLRDPDGGAPRADAAIDAPPDAPPIPDPVTTDFPSVADTFLAQDAQYTNFNGQRSALVDGDPRRTIVIRFDLSSVPADATITSAVLHIWSDTDPGGTVTFHRLLQSWNEGGATWRRRANGVAWANNGAGTPNSRSATAIGTVTPAQANTHYAVPIDTGTVQDWVTTPTQNHGLAIVTSRADGTRFSTREHPNPQVRPFLRVTYVP